MTTVSEVLAMAEDTSIHVKTLKAAASSVLGPDHTASSRIEIIDALQEIATQPDRPIEQDDMREVQTTRRYAPMGKYKVVEEDFPYDYEQVKEGVMRTVDAGSVVHLPLNEARRALQKGIAVVTATSL